MLPGSSQASKLAHHLIIMEGGKDGKDGKGKGKEETTEAATHRGSRGPRSSSSSSSTEHNQKGRMMTLEEKKRRAITLLKSADAERLIASGMADAPTSLERATDARRMTIGCAMLYIGQYNAC